ncbi:MAG TPA: hypothetical protein DDW36_04735 [Candidatus Magasanikbacteria bacterium]|nr:hypothetical protein [Candidatus Magasanikbacteria bacterium]
MTAQQKSHSQKFLKEIKEKLLEEKNRLERELGKFAQKAKGVEEDYDARFPDYGDKEDENAAEVAQYSTNLTLEQTLEGMLRDVDKSLDRIEKGNYGICKYCDRPIEEKRLRARPTSSSCVECKKTITQEL